MCRDCGCERSDTTLIESQYGVEKKMSATQAEMTRRTLDVRAGLLDKNDRLARHNRQRFQANGLCVLNVISAPGSGKTATIERMAREAKQQHDSMLMAAIVGDLATDNDARRLREVGIQAVQISTGTACHLDAAMVAKAIADLDLAAIDLLVIENVGNLVCPVAFDLGESLRVVVMSVTEGEDKPLKYPTAFKWADSVILNKLDIGKAVGFDRELALSNIHRIAPQTHIFEISARTGTGVATWMNHLHSRVAASETRDRAGPEAMPHLNASLAGGSRCNTNT